MSIVGVVEDGQDMQASSNVIWVIFCVVLFVKDVDSFVASSICHKQAFITNAIHLHFFVYQKL